MPHETDTSNGPAGMRHMTKKPSSSTGKGGFARSTMGTGSKNAQHVSGAMGKHQKTGSGEAF